MRKINGKFFLGLLLGTLVLTGAVFGVHHIQYQRLGQALLWQADRAEEEGDVERMARYLKRYLEFNPRDDEAKVRLARAWTGEDFTFARRSRVQALRLMDEVLRNEDRPQLRRELVALALKLGDFKLARDHLEILLPYAKVQEAERQAFPKEGEGEKPAPDADLGELEGHWGHLLEAEGKPEEALVACRLALAHAPGQRDIHVRLATLLRRHKETDPARRLANYREADAVIDALVRAAPLAADSYLARWRYRREFDLITDEREPPAGQVYLGNAAEDVASALQRAPQDPEVLLAAADLERLRGQLVRRDTRRPREERERLFAEHCRKATAHLERGLSLRQKQGRRTATDPILFQLLWHKANLLLDDLSRLEKDENTSPAEKEKQSLARAAEIDRTIEQVRNSPLPAAADYLKGRLLVHQRRWAEAARRLEHARALLGRQPDLAVQANLLLGRCYEQLEEPSQMQDTFKRVLDLHPESVPALLGLGAGEWVQGRLEEARARYREALRIDGVPPEALLDASRLEIEYQLSRDDADWREVDRLLGEAEEKNPSKFVEVALLRADALTARGPTRGGGLDVARDALKKARNKQPDSPALWTALADLERRAKDPDSALAILDEAAKKLGDRVDFRLARARCEAGKKDPAKPVDPEVARRINALADKAESFPVEERSRLYSGLADAQLRAGHFAEARGLWARVAKLPGYETDLRLRLLLFDLAMKVGDEEGMQATLDDIHAVEGDGGAYHLYGEALRLIWQARKEKADRAGALSRAGATLDQVLTRRPNWPPALLARAEIATLEGQTEEVIKCLREAVRHGETSPAVIRRLAVLLNESNRAAEAHALLNRLRRSLLRNSGLGRLAADVALRQKDYQKALELAKDAVRSDTQKPADLIWLGRVLAKANDPEGALAKFRQAVRLGEKDPEAWLALVEFLARQKRDEEATRAIAEAGEKLPEGVRLLTLGRCYHALGKADLAKEHFRKAYEARPDDVDVVRQVATYYLRQGDLSEAEPLLQKIIDGKVKAKPADITQARRGLAIILSSGTDFRRFRKALELVGMHLDERGELIVGPAREGEDTPEDRLFRARVLATQRHRTFRRHAIKLLEQLLRERALGVEDVFILAVLYDQDGSWAKARALLQQCVADKNHTPHHVAYYIRGLIRQDRKLDLVEATRWLVRLEELEKQHEVGPNGYGAVELRARILEATKQGDEALSLLREHAQRPGARPEDSLLPVASLGRQKRYEEAFELLTEVWKAGKCSPEAAGGVTVALMRAMKPTREQLDRVEGWLAGAVREHPDKLVLRMHLADLHDLRGEYPEAESEYREVLGPEKEPNNMVALNNLAWLLVMREGDVDEAERLVNRAIEGMGRRADLLDTRGLVHLARGQLAEAVADFHEASEEDPSPLRLYHLARAHHLAREREEARRVLRRAVDEGLAPEEMHPIEQETCRKLLEEYSLTVKPSGG